MNTAEPLVSIVTPSLNQGAFIEAAILSVLDQDYPRVEHIVVDGGSSDETLTILGRYPHLRWISETDGGQSDALNKGFRLATGDIYGWLNADDIYLPGAIAAAARRLSDSRAGLAHGGWRRIDAVGTCIEELEALPFDLREQLRMRNLVAQTAAFFTREAFEACGGIDERYHYAMDYDLVLKIASRFEIVRVEGILGAFRVHDGSKTAQGYYEHFAPEVRRISRRHGGPLLPPRYVDYLCVRHTALGRTREVARMLGRGDFARLVKVAQARVRRTHQYR